MRIIGLQAENFKRLRAVEISPAGNVVEITGNNSQGKSSILDAIWAALGGKNAAPAVPIRKGAEEARVHLDLGDIRVTRRFWFKEGGEVTTGLTVENKDGARYQSPQSMLDALVGELSFDPLEYTRLSSKEQLEVLKRFVTDFDFDANEKERQEAFEKRTEVGRNIRAQKANVEAIVIPADAPTERIDTADLQADLERAGTLNADIERRAAGRARMERDAQLQEERVTEYRSRATELRRQADEMDAYATRAEEEARTIRADLEKAEPLPEPIDTAAVAAKLEQARRHNTLVATVEQRSAMAAALRKLETEHDALTAKITACNAAKGLAVSKAKLPVPGLSIGDDEVLLNDLPLSQASGAEQLRLSVAIAAALNPKLRVIRVKDGSLLDADSWALLGELAETMGLQVWVETVATGRPGAVLIEDGSVAEAPTLAAAE